MAAMALDALPAPVVVKVLDANGVAVPGATVNFAVATGGVVGLFGPAILTYVLLYVSGVPLLEARLIENKTGYASYVGKTPAFLPIPPRWLSAERLRRK